MRLYKSLPKVSPEKLARFDRKKDLEVEPEYGALLYGLVRIHKPLICVETGTYLGASAEWIGKALRDNGHGQLFTCDTDPRYVDLARQKVVDLPVSVHCIDGAKAFRMFLRMDFIHIDGGDPVQRLEQIKLIGDDNVAPGGILVWHDAVLWYPQLYEYFTSRYDWPHLVFPTEVGAAVFQRPQ